MSASAFRTSAWGSVTRRKVELARPVLSPLIGDSAFRSVVMVLYYFKYMPVAFPVGLLAVVGTALAKGPIGTAPRVVEAVCIAYFVIGLPLMFWWMRRVGRLASKKLSDDLGYPIRARGALLNAEEWKTEIERAKQIYLNSHSGDQRREV
jgi:hypothetical protein